MHERPEGFEEAAVMLTGLNEDRIRLGLSILEKDFQNTNRVHHIVNDYDVNDVSSKVVKIILSYTDYVNRNVWKRF